jgi:ubiquinone/menaquinone biosynthesis C-methylase UbiE
MESSEYKKMDEMEKDHWWFVAKRNFLKVFIEKEVGNLKGLTVLDLGCGTGANMQMLIEMGAEVVGVDMSEFALKYCKEKKLDVVLGTAEKIPFEAGKFDLVLASDVLEHIENDANAVTEIKRVLRPQGVFISTVPAHQWLFSPHDSSLHHFRRYSRKQFFNLLKVEFNSIKTYWIHGLIFIPAMFQRSVMRLFRVKSSETAKTSKFLNKLFGYWYKMEYWFIKKDINLPVGLSLLGIVKKV